jgi:poly(3-hydroxybutyrate) depolymerase
MCTKSIAVTSIIFSLLSLFTCTNASLSQACTHPDRSPIEWRPKANDSRIFQVGHDPNNPREIRVHIPPNYNGSNVMLPVILAFHDKDMSTGEMEFESRLSDPEANEEFIVVYPTAKDVRSSEYLLVLVHNLTYHRTNGNPTSPSVDGRRRKTPRRRILQTM